jgi:hypothetical protein
VSPFVRLVSLAVFAASASIELAEAADVCGEVKRLEAMAASGFKDVPLKTDKGYEAIAPVLGAQRCVVSRVGEQFVRCEWSSTASLDAHFKTLVEGVEACFPAYRQSTVAYPGSQASSAANFESEDERRNIDIFLSEANGAWSASLTVAVMN